MRIGEQLKALRKEKNVTLYELSDKTGVAIATLSRMENNKMTGTIECHQLICKTLGVSLGELYKQVEDTTKVVEPCLKKNKTEYLKNSPDIKYELLITKPQDKKIIPVILRIAVDGETQKEEQSIGVEKFIYMISGEICVIVGEKSFILAKGDSLYFDASFPHSFKNTGKEEARAFYISSSAN
ncbi:MerR family transcriptional regulator [Candidatus Omnitrophus magneticus]|uniref:MerR family transcriptional regulator n=1 Tax=Candidatus Omnitrophus magneticus TaxID=1609969 RepID=A0A0F0CQM7_9BACT|nr:MerR family transcriptional regulator [Candidatus Omnitrophus magneticus]